MGASKNELFSAQQNELARIARVLSHPARIAIVQHLIKVDSCIGNEIVESIPLSQPTISRHLKELKDVGIVTGTISGTRINYCIDKERWEEVKGTFGRLFTQSIRSRECC